MVPKKTVQYGTVIKLQHSTTKRFLKESKWMAVDDDEQQLVVTTPEIDEATDWIVETEHAVGEGQVTPGTVRLRNCETQRRLHSHTAVDDRRTFANCREVTVYDGNNGSGDENDRWRLTLRGGDRWLEGEPIELEHTGKDANAIDKKLCSTAASQAPLIADEQIVTCQRESNENTMWIAVNVRSTQQYTLDAIMKARRQRDQKLSLANLNLTEIPQKIGSLTDLVALDLSNNRLARLPHNIAQLTSLTNLNLRNNPLNPDLQAASNSSTDAVLRYLRELAKGSKNRYEAKLLVLGDGNEGKTCVSRALRGLPFQKQVTTRGVDVERWSFKHPDYADDPARNITLNIWDFEGQEINHQTHQFFLTTDAIYLLVFKCREQFRLDRAEYWLDTIRARAPKAKVAIVITECEGRMPVVPQDRIQAQYGNLLASSRWFFEVGCENNKGVEDLQSSLKRLAADLEFMGEEWPESYSRAEDTLRQMASAGTQSIDRKSLHAVFESHDIPLTTHRDATYSMARLGIITDFPDCPDLAEFVVLQPQWLTKAISEVMEDTQLSKDRGLIAMARMQELWDAKGYRGLFANFHTCMKEFELSYDLDSNERNCLVPLRFGYDIPQIPWSRTADQKERRIEYKLNLRPPMGFMSRFIVKTHHMIATTSMYPKGVFWQHGVFLRDGEGAFLSEALCTFEHEDRKLSIVVRAAFPQALIEQIHAYVKAVFSFFPGLDAERHYGCIRLADDGTEINCPRFHSESRIYSAILKKRVLDCEYEAHDIDPRMLVSELSNFGEHAQKNAELSKLLRKELDRPPTWAESLIRDMGSLLAWTENSSKQIDNLIAGQIDPTPALSQQLNAKFQEYLRLFAELLDNRDHSTAPSLVLVCAKNINRWNPASYFRETFILTPFCEQPGQVHPCEDASIEFTRSRDWWTKSAPWLSRAIKVFSVGIQLAHAGMPLIVPKQSLDIVRDRVNFMTELSKHLEFAAPQNSLVPKMVAGQSLDALAEQNKLIQASIAYLFKEIAPINYSAQKWGTLDRVRMGDNSFRWICQDCRKRYGN